MLVRWAVFTIIINTHIIISCWVVLVMKRTGQRDDKKEKGRPSPVMSVRILRSKYP